MRARPTGTVTPAEAFIRLPDPPEPEDMNNWKFFNSLGNGINLIRHLGNEARTIITSDTYVSHEPTSSPSGLFLPDLLIALNVDPQACDARNGYVIAEQGKPPDFVLEIGLSSTGQRDATVKRDGYAALSVGEYWRFDPSGGSYQGTPLAGDLLVAGIYQPIAIERLDDETLQGYSNALDLNLRWERGQLGWYDPRTGEHVLRYDDYRDRAHVAEARVRELEAELRRHQQF